MKINRFYILAGIIIVVMQIPLMYFRCQRVEAVTSDTLARQCVESFNAAKVTGDVDAQLSHFTVPAYFALGNYPDTLDKVRAELANDGPAPNISPRVVIVLPLTSYDAWARANGMRELTADERNVFPDFIGADGRLVVVELARKDNPRKVLAKYFVMVKVENGEAKMVSAGVK